MPSKTKETIQQFIQNIIDKTKSGKLQWNPDPTFTDGFRTVLAEDITIELDTLNHSLSLVGAKWKDSAFGSCQKLVPIRSRLTTRPKDTYEIGKLLWTLQKLIMEETPPGLVLDFQERINNL